MLDGLIHTFMKERELDSIVMIVPVGRWTCTWKVLFRAVFKCHTTFLPWLQLYY